MAIEHDALYEEWLEQKDMLKKSLKQRCKWEQNWSLPRWERFWLTFKVWVCIILNLKLNKRAEYDDRIVAAILDGGTYSCEWGICGWEEDLYVGKGLLRNWWYDIERDGWP